MEEDKLTKCEYVMIVVEIISEFCGLWLRGAKVVDR